MGQFPLPLPLRSEREEDESADGRTRTAPPAPAPARGDILMTDELCSAVERKKKKRKTEKEKETNLSPPATLARSVRVRIMLAGCSTYRGISWLRVPDS